MTRRKSRGLPFSESVGDLAQRAGGELLDNVMAAWGGRGKRDKKKTGDRPTDWSTQRTRGEADRRL